MKSAAIIQFLQKWFNNGYRIFDLTARRYRENHHLERATALTFYTIFAIVPVGALIFGIIKGFSLEKPVYYLLIERSSRFSMVFATISEYAAKALSEASGGVVATIGLLALVWTAMNLVIHVERSFNAIWGLPGRRTLWRKLSDYAALVLFTPLAIVLISAVDLHLASVTDTFAGGEGRWNCFMYEAMIFCQEWWSYIFCGILLGVIYRFVPNTREVKFKNALLSGFMAVTSFIVLKNLMFFLQSSVFTYNKVYGGFAALPLLLLWLNWSWCIILFFGEFCFVSQNMKSGIFTGRELRKLSFKQRLEYQLLIVHEVFRSFSDPQNGAMTEEDLFRRIALPENVLRRELYELTSIGIIRRAGEGESNVLILPGISPEKFTVADFIKKLGGAGEESIADFAKCDDFFRQLEEQLARGCCGIPVRDLNIYVDKQGDK